MGVLAAFVWLVASGCGDVPTDPVTPPTAEEDQETVPSPPLEVLEAIAEGFAALGVSVPVPAVVQRFAGSWISVAWIEGIAHRVYAEVSNGAGRVPSTRLIRPAVIPVGVIRTVTVFVDHGNTNVADLWPVSWESAQSRQNSELANLSQSLGLSEPVVRFDNFASVLVGPGLFDPRSRTEVSQYLQSIGIAEDDWDILLVANWSTTVEGGFGGGDMAYIGCFKTQQVCDGPYDLRAPEGTSGLSHIGWLARVLYDHEVGHIWGWEHEWTPDWPPGSPFITDPALFGWIDADGDGTIEILDANPYGR